MLPVNSLTRYLLGKREFVLHHMQLFNCTPSKTTFHRLVIIMLWLCDPFVDRNDIRPRQSVSFSATSSALFILGGHLFSISLIFVRYREHETKAYGRDLIGIGVSFARFWGFPCNSVLADSGECKGKLLFVDCRNQTSAYGNIALGGGFEVYGFVVCTENWLTSPLMRSSVLAYSLDYYKDTNIMFMGIENIHSMRDSIRKLFDLIKNEVRGNERPNWLSCLEVRMHLTDRS